MTSLSELLRDPAQAAALLQAMQRGVGSGVGGPSDAVGASPADVLKQAGLGTGAQSVGSVQRPDTDDGLVGVGEVGPALAPTQRQTFALNDQAGNARAGKLYRVVKDRGRTLHVYADAVGGPKTVVVDGELPKRRRNPLATQALRQAAAAVRGM